MKLKLLLFVPKYTNTGRGLLHRVIWKCNRHKTFFQTLSL